MIKERRRHARLRIPLEAEYQVAGEEAWRQGTIWTLGAGGAALLCDERLDVGAVLSALHFIVEAEGDLPETRIEVGAEVVNVDREGDFGCRSCFMLGLRFVNLAEQEIALLRQFVFRRLTGAQALPGNADSSPAIDAPPIEIRFKLFDEFVDEVSENLSPTGMFIRAHRPPPPGSRFAFQFQLGDDFSLFQGMAEVVWTRRRSEGPERPAGMGVRFLKLDLTSQRMVRRLVDQRDTGEAGNANPADPAAEPPELAGAAAAEPQAPPSAEPGADAEPAVPAEATQLDAEPVVGGGSAGHAAEPATSAAEPSALRQLTERLGAAEAASDEARERLTRLTMEVDALREELRVERAARAAAEEARESAEGAAEEVRAEMETAARRAADELGRRQAEWGALETELRERLDRSQARRDDLERLAERAEEADSDLERLRSESAEAQREAEAIEAELRAQLERQGAERADLEDRLAQEEGTAAGLRQRVAELEEQVARDAKIEAALREQARELRAAPAELEARLRRATEQLRRLRAAAGAMKSGFGDDLGAARAVDGELADRLAEVAAAGADLEEKVGGLSAARSDLAERLTRLAGAWSEFEDGLAEAGEDDLAPEEAPTAEQAAAEPEAAPPPREAAAVEVGDAQEPPENPPVVPTEPGAEPQAPAAEPERPEPVSAAPLASPESPEAATEPPSPAPSEADSEGAGPSEPSAAARLVGAARRAAARLGLARASSTDGNGSSPDLDTSGEPPGSNGGKGAEAIDETVRAWAAAWSEQRVEDYLSFYSSDFQPVQATDGDQGESVQAWLPPLTGMELKLGPISHTELSPGRFAVQFEQCVVSDSYTRRTGRTLELVREADAWKIAAESFQEL